MRIVYDDSEQENFLDVCDKFINMLQSLRENAKELGLVAYSNGTNRVQDGVLKRMLADFVKDYGFEIGKTVTHAYGIGNNCGYPVYYRSDGKPQQCAVVHINHGMFGETYFGCTDYNNHRIWGYYELNCGVWNQRRKCYVPWLSIKLS